MPEAAETAGGLGPEAASLLDGPHPCTITSSRADGRPRSVVVWCGREGDVLTVNAGLDATWLKRLRRTGFAAVAVTDHADMRRGLTADGRVISVTPDPHLRHLNRLAAIYQPASPFSPGPRVGPRLRVDLTLEKVQVFDFRSPSGA